MVSVEIQDPFEKESDLSASTLYRSEVLRLPRLSRAEQAVLVDRARQGHQESAHALVVNCLHWALLMAHRIYEERQPSHVEILDLASEANVKMVEQLDKALTANDPVAYLMSIASQTIRVYCTYHAPLIQRPEWLSRKQLVELSPFLPPMNSLDEPLSPDNPVPRKEYLVASPLSAEAEEEREHRSSSRFALLYEAVKRLNCDQRATTIRLYGLFGQPKETASEIASTSHLPYRRVTENARLARSHLRRCLTDHLPQMTRSRLISTGASHPLSQEEQEA
jgi:DNA-directed RNA polymerase specialized sigma24 family protein